MRNYPVYVQYSPADKAFVAVVPDLKGCSAHGSSPGAAVEEAYKAAALFLEVLAAQGQSAPEPKRWDRTDELIHYASRYHDKPHQLWNQFRLEAEARGLQAEAAQFDLYYTAGIPSREEEAFAALLNAIKRLKKEARTRVKRDLAASRAEELGQVLLDLRRAYAERFAVLWESYAPGAGWVVEALRAGIVPKSTSFNGWETLEGRAVIWQDAASTWFYLRPSRFDASGSMESADSLEGAIRGWLRHRMGTEAQHDPYAPGATL